MSVSKVCYTVLMGKYEEIKRPRVITPGWRYIAYTNQPVTSDVWEIVSCAVDNPLEAARRVKLTYFERFEKSVYVDASFFINCNLDDWWNRYGSEFTVINHPLRSCVYDEITACRRNKRAGDEIYTQRDAYKLVGLPQKNGMIQSGILMRENKPEVIKFCKLWHDQLKFSKRDQVGFALIDWVLPIAKKVDWNYLKDSEFQYVPHFHRSNRELYLNKIK